MTTAAKKYLFPLSYKKAAFPTAVLQIFKGRQKYSKRIRGEKINAVLQNVISTKYDPNTIQLSALMSWKFNQFSHYCLMC